MSGNFAIVGLRNFGNEFKDTRHNYGEFFLDYVHSNFDASPWVTKNKYEFSNVLLEGCNFYLVKLKCGINDSGVYLLSFMKDKKITINNIMIAYDDADLSIGSFNIRVNGGARGHNGVRSIIRYCGSDFIKLRLGIDFKNRRMKTNLNSYVLGVFSIDDKRLISSVVKEACIAMLDFFKEFGSCKDIRR